jgi:hypothetical protein
MKENEIGGACSMHDGNEILVRNSESKSPLGAKLG